MRGGPPPAAVACTPAGCLALLDRYGVDLAGKRAAVLGRSNIVGAPVARLLADRDATVSMLHSRSKDVPSLLADADVVVSGVGEPGFVRGSWLKPGCVVLDVGINAVEDADAPQGYRLVGDVRFDEALDVASLVTPVPGGVGPIMTVAMLLQNTLRLAAAAVERGSAPPPVKAPTGRRAFSTSSERAFSTSSERAFSTTRPLSAEALAEPPAPRNGSFDFVSPTPSDIDISQACDPLEMTDVADELGLVEKEMVPWGFHKAKVDAPKVHARLGAAAETGSLVVVCGINPTPLGEGKSTSALGLSQALGGQLGKKCCTTIRQPSQGPTFGIKGGAAGGGYSQVVPMEEFNLHMTGRGPRAGVESPELCPRSPRPVRDPSPRTIHVKAAASPRPVSTDYPRRRPASAEHQRISRGGTATRLRGVSTRRKYVTAPLPSGSPVA